MLTQRRSPAEGDLVAFQYMGFYSVEIAEENESLKNEIAALSGCREG